MAAEASPRPHSDLERDVLEAFWAYERALKANDVDALDEAFSAGESALRSDGTTVTVGASEIARMRRVRAVIPRRAVTSVHVVPSSADGALVMASLRSPQGMRGTQTQLWERRDDRWRVVAAHVTSTQAPFDRSVWRVLGAPLVAGASEGECAGLRVAVKDLFAVAGMTIGAGIPERAALAPRESAHAWAVDRLLAAGADVTGIAQTDQFAYGLAGQNGRFGTPLNVAQPDRVPGGSTSGGATAVALGWADLALGTDTAGSLRVPAAYQRLWGIRTTHGMVPRDGVLPLAPSFDAVGALARDVDTLQRAIRELNPSASRQAPGGWMTVPALTRLADDDARSLVNQIARHTGARECEWGIDLDAAFTAFRTVQAAEAWHAHGAWITDHPGVLSDDVAERFALASTVADADAHRAYAVIDEVRATLRDQLGDRILVLPTTSTQPPPLDASDEEMNAHRARTLRLNCIASLAGLPAVALPVGHDGTSVCLVGPAGSDLALLEVAGDLHASFSGQGES
ncbi:hypothetical protein GCM10009808_24320 [Microbacterium sediminicola]|uniref:Amidase domain-containing protein n=1 Tax=Microbacterium sediminicola TaxID=415210 RepID=A0ABN2II62_9MICO